MGKQTFSYVAGGSINWYGNLAKSTKVTYPFRLDMEMGLPDIPFQGRSCPSCWKICQLTIFNCQPLQVLPQLPRVAPSKVSAFLGQPTDGGRGIKAFSTQCGPILVGHFSSTAPLWGWLRLHGAPSKLNFSFCSIPLPPSPFRRC